MKNYRCQQNSRVCHVIHIFSGSSLEKDDYDKFHHCRRYVTGFRERAFWSLPHPWAVPKRPILKRVTTWPEFKANKRNTATSKTLSVISNFAFRSNKLWYHIENSVFFFFFFVFSEWFWEQIISITDFYIHKPFISKILKTNFVSRKQHL